LVVKQQENKQLPAPVSLDFSYMAKIHYPKAVPVESWTQGIELMLKSAIERDCEKKFRESWSVLLENI
jgi:hypothetical protein